MTADSSGLRQRVLADHDAGMATGDVAAKYRVGPSGIRRLKQRRHETGSGTAKARRHGPEPTRADHAERIAAAPSTRGLTARSGNTAGGPGQG